MYGGADAAAAGGLGAAEGAGLGSATYGAAGGPSAFMQGAGITGGTGAASALTGSSALTSGLAAGGGGFLSGLAGSGWLGPLATLAGGVLGSKSRDQSQTTRSEIDPRMVPYMYGSNGIMPMAQQIAMRQMNDPRISGAYQQMRDQGGFLMSRPVAGNGYTQRYGSR